MTNQRTTGKSFLYALGITFLVSGGLSLVYFLMFVIGDFLTDNTRTANLEWILSRAWFASKTTFICSGPIVLILSFALLQRFRVKPNDNARN